MTEPRVLHYRNRDTPNSIYIGRPSKWGNPFTIGKDGTRSDVIRKYIKYLQDRPNLLRAARTELRGKNLVCWCAPQECHGDVLLGIAND